MSPLLLWFALALSASACADWSSANSGGPWLQPYGNAAGTADAGPASPPGIVQWDTWKAPEAGAGQVDVKADGSKDTALAADTGADAADAAEDTGTDPTDATVAPDAADSEDLVLQDGVDPDTALADASDGAAVPDVPYTLDGKADFVGWPELPPPTPDVAVPEVSGADVAPTDGQEPDGTVGPDATPEDATPEDATPEDAIEEDAIAPETFPPDVILPDDVESDVQVPDASGEDASPPDAAVSDTLDLDSTVPDAGSVDGGTADASWPDALPETGDAAVLDSSLSDGVQAPDWQGYPDMPFADDADVYGGAIGSCLSMYLYQQEVCGNTNPTAACIDSITADGSLFAKFQFEPLRLCETTVCTDLCAKATDKQCMDNCIAKYCAAPFLACTSNGAQGPQSCADAWKCSKQFPDKLLTISAKCYAAATAEAQQKFSAVIGCVSKPQTKGCIPEVSACFSAGTAATASCSSTLTCMNACNSDEICGFGCMGQASPAAVQLVDAIWNCSLAVCTPKCVGSSDPACQDDCMKSECQSQLVQCLVN